MDGFWPFCALGDALGDVTGDNITGGSTDSAGSGLGGDTAGDTGHSLVFPFFACKKIPKSFFGTAGLKVGVKHFLYLSPCYPIHQIHFLKILSPAHQC